MSITFDIMPRIQMAVDTVQIRCFRGLLIIKVGVLALFGKFKREQVFVTFDAARFVNMPPGNFQSATVIPVE
jgi:hypothetical protein